MTQVERFYVADVLTSLRGAVEHPEAKAWCHAVYAAAEPALALDLREPATGTACAP